MDTITFDNIIEKILKKFPEYKNSSQYFDESNIELPYVVLGNLCLMAFEDIDNKKDTRLAEELVGWTDEIFNDPRSDDELINLFSVEVLENLVSSRKGAILAKKIFHGKSVEFLDLTLKHYSTDDFLEEYRSK